MRDYKSAAEATSLLSSVGSLAINMVTSLLCGAIFLQLNTLDIVRKKDAITCNKDIESIKLIPSDFNEFTCKSLESFVTPCKRESRTFLDSGFHAVDSGFRVLDSGFQHSGFRIPIFFRF